MNLRDSVRLWRELLTRCRRRSPWLFAACIATLVVDVGATVLVGLSLREIVTGSLHGSSGQVLIGALGAAAAYAVNLRIGDAGDSLRRTLGYLVAYEQVEFEVWDTLMGTETIAHLEHPGFLNVINPLYWSARSWVAVASAWAAVETASAALRIIFVLALLGTINPLLAVVLVAAAAPVLLGQRSRRRERAIWRAGQEQFRLHWHLQALAVSASAGKEIRVAGYGPDLVERQRAAAEASQSAFTRAQWRTFVADALGWLLFSLVFIGGIALVTRQTASPAAGLGDVVLTVSIGSQLRAIVEQAVQTAALNADNARALEALRWVRKLDTEQKTQSGPSLAPPDRIAQGIVFENVGFGYEGAGRNAIDDVSLKIAPGSVVAIVGEYGSGKTTIMKLLTKMYRPTSGRILIDGVDLAQMDTAAWRSRLSAAFQDFGRYNVALADAVGIGEITLTGAEREARITDAIGYADAEVVLDKLPDGLNTQLGRLFGGVDLSEGQWQKLALARASMRTDPLLFVLDEPTASLDAPSEAAVFQRYMARARTIAERTGGITVIVSHRFSTVAGADQILVLDKGRLVEVGTHTELLANAGSETSRYAELFGLQRAAYATGDA